MVMVAESSFGIVKSWLRARMPQLRSSEVRMKMSSKILFLIFGMRFRSVMPNSLSIVLKIIEGNPSHRAPVVWQALAKKGNDDEYSRIEKDGLSLARL